MATSCKKCNNHKGGRTPEEAGMMLIRKPFKPKKEHMIKFNELSVYSEEWKEFLS
jgi:hypothetical protein